MKRMVNTKISSTATRHCIPRAAIGARLTYQASRSSGSSYRLPMHEPATKEERRRLRDKWSS